MDSLARRVEHGGALSVPAAAAAAQPFFTVLLHKLLPARPVVVVTENLKIQEGFQQDLETWLAVTGGAEPGTRRPSAPLFYPAWEILPHEGKLPHADVISERLQTLVALAQPSEISNFKSQIIVTSVVALLQKTFAPDDLKERTRNLRRGDKVAPLDLIEFLEEQGYEPEAQVSQKGEIALRGGIVDLFPPTSPWPVRLEFFGDELESLRYFDPLTQISREEVSAVTIPPAGEIGILKRAAERGPARGGSGLPVPGGPASRALFATLLDHLPRETIFILCEPESLAVYAETYAGSIPSNDPFFISWPAQETSNSRR